jgi:hypothetical protein
LTVTVNGTPTCGAEDGVTVISEILTWDEKAMQGLNKRKNNIVIVSKKALPVFIFALPAELNIISD